MDTKHFHSSTSLPEGSKKQDSLQQEPNNSHQSPSQSSQTYTNVPSGTGASAQSATTLAEHVEPNQYQAVFAHHTHVRSTAVADEQDLSLVGSWTAVVDPQPDPFLIENDPILSQINRVGTTVEPTRNNTETTDRNRSESTEEAAGILRTSLQREV